MAEEGEKMMEEGESMKKEGEDMMEEGKNMMKDENGQMEGESMMKEGAGSYEEYSPEKVAEADGDIVLFFHATWCPYCKELNDDINASLSDIPANLTILKTDYDTYTSLKQKYGVTVQHTLVQVDSAGNLIAKWSGSFNLEDLISHIK